MDALVAKSGRSYTPLPIDGARGFPQSFPFSFEGQSYRYRLYFNVAAELLDARPEFIETPSEEAFLVVQVDRDLAGATGETIFQRKVVPGLEYEAEEIALLFSAQRLARANLNGQGEHGTRVLGGIARRWA
jgi:hypothetical protein